MSRKNLPIISTVIVAVAFFISSVLPAHAALLSDPLLKAPLNQRDRYQTDLFSGTANYSYPIKIPKGTDNLTPEISLNYNSSGARDHKTYLGLGWVVNQDYVERIINYTPGSTSDDSYRLHFKGQVYDLVYVSSEGRYHTKVESYLNIQKLTGASNYIGEYWQVITPDGTKYRFGSAGNSENVCSNLNYVSTWNLDQVTDVHNNKIYYTYLEYAGLSYLQTITYNNDESRTVELNYETNPYEHPTYNEGCYAYDLKRLTNIQVKVNNNLVHEYDISFGTAGNTQPTLDSITEKGSDRTALPATTFDYKPEIHSWATSSATWINHADIDAHLEQSNVTMSDVNGDGLTDIVRTDNGSGGNTYWKVLLNTGSAWSTTYQYWVNNAAVGALLDDGKTQLIDVTGDNLPDIVHSDSASTWKIYRNTGTSWNTSSEQWGNISGYSGAVLGGTGNNAAVLADVNGDGLADIINSWWNGAQEYRVFKNTGSGWNGTPEVWSYNTIPVGLEHSSLRVMDVNGDGLADVVRTVYSGSLSTWYVWKSTGSGFGSQTIWLDDYVNAHFGTDDEGKRITVSDVNGDSLPDIVRGEPMSGGFRWKVLYNRGGSWENDYDNWIETTDSIDFGVDNKTVRLADVNGDGLPDIVKGQQDCSCGYVTWKVLKNNNVSPHLLAAVHTSQGGIISFDYKPTTQFDQTGSDDLSDLPFPMWVVTKKTENNGMSTDQQTNVITEYGYYNGLYKWQDHEFRGFQVVIDYGPGDSENHYVFRQDDALKGKVQELQYRNSASYPYAEKEEDWSSTTSNGVYIPKMDSEKKYTYDGTASNPKVVQTDYTYDSYGNVTKKSELGDTDITGDERYTYNEYVASTSGWIVNLPKHTYLNASNDSTKVAESWFYYDGHSGNSDTPEKGDLTKEVKWLSGGTNPETTYSYDSFGNQTSVTNARNHTTTTAYDTTGTYPVSTTNAKNQTSYTNYDLGTGNLLSKTDANGFSTNYTYDVYARLLKEIKPYDSSSSATIQYTHIIDGIDGLKTQRKTASGSALTTYTWVDGFGRTIQTRTDAEDTSKQIVTENYYDPTGQISKVTVPHLDSLIDYYGTPVASISATETTYGPLGRVEIVENPKGDEKTFAYDHWKVTEIDENGHIKRKFTNAFDKIVKVQEVLNNANIDTLYEYDSRDLLTKIEDAPGNETTFTYDTLGRKTQQIDPDMGTWSYAYDGASNLTSQTDNRGVTVTKNYDELNRLTKTDYPNDTDTTFVYDGNGKKGTVTIATDSAGTANFFYDNRLRKTSENRSVNGTTKTTAWTYDSADRQVTQTNPDSEVITNTFNAQGEIETVSNLLTNINYNAFGKITKKSFANSLDTDYTYNTTDFRLNRIQTGSLQDLNYTYDNVGNVSTIADNVASKTQTFGYDDLDRLKVASESAGGYNYNYTYNSIGNLTAFNDGTTTINYLYGAGDRPHAMASSSETVSPPNPAPSGTPLTATLKDNWSTNTIASSKWNNWAGSHASASSSALVMTSSLGGGYYGVDSEVGTKVYNLTGSSVVNQLVNAGNQSVGSWEVYPIYAYVKGDSSTQYFFYISENTLRAYKKVSGSNTILASTTYSSTNHKWFRIREASGTTYFDTSANGTSWSNFASTSNAFTLTSLVIGSEVGTWSSEGSTTSATFDNFNYATLPTSELKDDWSGGTISGTHWSDWSGGQASVSAGKLYLTSTMGGGYYGLEGATNYNLTGSYIVNQLVSAGNQSLGSWEVYPIYAYLSGDSSTQYFFYISENTLRAYKKVSGSNTILASASYSSTNHKWFRIRENAGTTYFDTSADGGTWNNFASTANAFNVTSLVVGSEVGSWSSEASATSAIMDNFNTWAPVYTYDDNGNMISDGHTCYEFNDANQMKKAKTCDGGQTIAEYVYDYNGNRMVKKTYEGGSLKETITSWSDGYETKVTGGTTENTAYYFVNNELIGKKDNAGTRTFVHNDHLGSASLVTNSAGALVEQTKYDAWGEVLSGGTASKFLYTGQEKDLETNLNYYNARYYDSHIRRFTQPDSIVENIYEPQMLNRYSYVSNNPIRYTDPSGHCIGIFTSICAPVMSFISQVFQPVTNLFTKASSSSVTQKVAQNVPKIQSNPVVQKTGNNVNQLSNSSVIKEENRGANINITNKSLNHVLERHVENGINSMNKSIFSNPSEIRELVKNAEELEPILQKNGNLRRIVDAGKMVGKDSVTGQETSFYTVITNYNVVTKTENLVTAHPGLPR